MFLNDLPYNNWYQTVINEGCRWSSFYQIWCCCDGLCWKPITAGSAPTVRFFCNKSAYTSWESAIQACFVYHLISQVPCKTGQLCWLCSTYSAISTRIRKSHVSTYQGIFCRFLTPWTFDTDLRLSWLKKNIKRSVPVDPLRQKDMQTSLLLGL